MRFPPKAYNKDLESAEVGRPFCLRYATLRFTHCLPTLRVCLCVFQERREREQQDLEFAKEMAEDDDDSFP